MCELDEDNKHVWKELVYYVTSCDEVSPTVANFFGKISTPFSTPTAEILVSPLGAPVLLGSCQPSSCHSHFRYDYILDAKYLSAVVNLWLYVAFFKHYVL
jgi:hypothetical protein